MAVRKAKKVLKKVDKSFGRVYCLDGKYHKWEWMFTDHFGGKIKWCEKCGSLTEFKPGTRWSEGKRVTDKNKKPYIKMPQLASVSKR